MAASKPENGIAPEIRNHMRNELPLGAATIAPAKPKKEHDHDENHDIPLGAGPQRIVFNAPRTATTAARTPKNQKDRHDTPEDDDLMAARAERSARPPASARFTTGGRERAAQAEESIINSV